MARHNNRRSSGAAVPASGSHTPGTGVGVDLSLSQAQDVNWDEVDYDNDMNAAQAAGDRRRLQREMRNLMKQTTADPAQFYGEHADMVHTVLDESADLLKQTRQTTEAAIDAALVIRISELAYKRTTHFLADRTDDTGVNLEDFAARCKDYMRFGRGLADPNSPDLSRAQRRRRRIEALAHRRGGDDSEQGAVAGDGGDDDGDVEGDAANNDGEGGEGGQRWEKLDWDHFGQYACLPHTRRPGLARFLPRAALPADDKTRVLRKRTAALRLHELQEVRPQVLRADDLGVSQNSDLTTLANDILRQLHQATEQGQEQVQSAYNELEENEDEGADGSILQRLMDRYGIRSDGGVDLIRFAVNPRSFAQTVENFFYISFLVRDGRVGLAYDDNGLPSIYPVSEEDGGEYGKESGGGGAREDTQKHQLILSIDMAMWREMVETFNIRHSMIAHRETATAAHPGGRAWFT